MGMIDKNIEERIKQSANIVDVLEELGVQLIKRGSEYDGICPFHNDHHMGSFKVNENKNFYQCFSCGAHGGPVDAVMELQHKTYPEALRWLAAKYSIFIDYEPVPEVKRCEPRKPLPEKTIMRWPIKVATYYIDQTGNPLINWMLSQLNDVQQSRLRQMLCFYLVGTVQKGEENGWTIWWQINESKQICRGHIMQYKADGHRQKDGYNNTWAHTLSAKAGKFDKDKYDVKGCLFGLHLIYQFPDAEIVIVESEKTAVFCSALTDPHKRLFMATCGSNGLNRRNLQPLIDNKRKVVLLPDHDMFDEWKQIASEIGNDRVQVSNELERIWRPSMGDKADIMDALIYRQNNPMSVSDEAHSILGLKEENKELTYFINQLNLRIV